MKSQRDNSIPYVIAAIGSIVIVTFLPILFYFVLIFVTADVGGSLNFVLIPCSNLVAAILFTTVLFFPLSKLLDWLLQKISQNGQRIANSFLLSVVVWVLLLVLVTGSFAFAIGMILENPLALRILGKQDVDIVMVSLLRFLFLGGVSFVLGGATYWFLLQTSRKAMSNYKDGQELSEYSKAG